MKVYGVNINTKAEPCIYTSLAELCNQFGLKYSTVVKKKQIDMCGVKTRIVCKRYKGTYTFYDIKEYELVKIKGRENNAKGKQIPNSDWFKETA